MGRTRAMAGQLRRLPLATLAAVFLLQLIWWADYHEERWNNVVRLLGKPGAEASDGLVIQWNGMGYYAWLRSLLIDHDWDFDNEFDEHAVPGQYVPPPSYRTPSGRRANQWSVGPACLWSLYVVPCHYMLKALGEPWAANGYSLPYQLAVAAGTLSLSFVGLVFLYGICRHFARPDRAALAAAWVTLGTMIFYYSAIEVSLPHAPGTALLSILVWYWLKSYGSPRLGRWLLVGLLLGGAALMRWQLLTFAVLPGGEALAAPGPSRLGNRLVRLALAGLGVVAALLPQLAAWRCVYGSWLVMPIGGVQYHWLDPSLWQILCSHDRSLFYWTPLAAVTFAGMLIGSVPLLGPLVPCRDRRLPILFVAFLLQVYTLAGMWGQGELLPATGNFAGVFLARSFGLRDLTESLVVLAPGLAIVLQRLRARGFLAMLAVGYGLVAWNLLLVGGYATELLPQISGTEPGALLAAAWGFASRDPLLCATSVVCLLLVEVARRSARPARNLRSL